MSKKFKGAIVGIGRVGRTLLQIAFLRLALTVPFNGSGIVWYQVLLADYIVNLASAFISVSCCVKLFYFP